MTYGVPFFWLLLCGHLAGDFFLRTWRPAPSDGKSRLRRVLRHNARYAVALLLCAGSLFRAPALFYIVAVSAFHLLTDALRLRLAAGPRRERLRAFVRRYGFTVGQLLDAAAIACVAYFGGAGLAGFNPFGAALLRIYGRLCPAMPFDAFSRLLFTLLLILKPANVIIHQMNTKARSDSERPAGKTIGVLERLLTFIFVLLRQYAAVALIFTAKSITRYDRIAKDPQFAEYYLIGTLMSVLIAILAALLAAPLFPAV